eukprot:2652655-Pleurochrysis_carterae.AAC.2
MACLLCDPTTVAHVQTLAEKGEWVREGQGEEEDEGEEELDSSNVEDESQSGEKEGKEEEKNGGEEEGKQAMAVWKTRAWQRQMLLLLLVRP